MEILLFIGIGVLFSLVVSGFAIGFSQVAERGIRNPIVSKILSLLLFIPLYERMVKKLDELYVFLDHFGSKFKRILAGSILVIIVATALYFLFRHSFRI